MVQTPVVQVRLDGDRLAFLDSLPGSRSEAIRHCVDFTKDNDEDPRSRSGTQADLIEALRQDSERRVAMSKRTVAATPAAARPTPSFLDHPEGTCDDPACPRFACRKKS